VIFNLQTIVKALRDQGVTRVRLELDIGAPPAAATPPAAAALPAASDPRTVTLDSSARSATPPPRKSRRAHGTTQASRPTDEHGDDGEDPESPAARARNLDLAHL
jgi:hypothetical protein